VDSVGSGQGPAANSCEHGDKPSGSGATELVIHLAGILGRETGQSLGAYLHRTAQYTRPRAPPWDSNPRS
jgi:hypothetical protein